ncbi:L domain-like protein, partial [Rhizoclosmatium globosum]
MGVQHSQPDIPLTNDDFERKNEYSLTIPILPTHSTASTQYISNTTFLSLPRDLFVQLFRHIPPQQLLPLRRVCKTFNTCLQTRHFALANLSTHINRDTQTLQTYYPDVFDRLWFQLPDVYQLVYAQSYLSHVSEIDWAYARGVGKDPKIPRAIGVLKGLQKLELTFMDLTGEIPVEIEAIGGACRYLSLGCNRLVGRIPKEVGSLAGLTSLYLGKNQLSGEIPGELGLLSMLRSMNLSGNMLTGGIPKEFGQLKELRELRISENKIGGEIPLELGSCRYLECFSVGDNELCGSIPGDAVGNWTRLATLDLKNNRLSGEIPRQVANLVSVEIINLSGNKLRGEIPRGFGMSPNLRRLNLADNYLSGSIPWELSGAINLRWIYLQNNELTGRIPEEMGPMRLCALQITHNYMDRPVPSQLRKIVSLYDRIMMDSKKRSWRRRV